MSKAKETLITESLQELRGYLKKSSHRIRPRVQMLVAIKKK